jgi:hypothetical protein
MNGQATWLSFVALGGWLKLSRWAKRSFRGAGAMAAFTVSSNRPNSTSLITLSEFGSAGFLTTTHLVNRHRVIIEPNQYSTHPNKQRLLAQQLELVRRTAHTPTRRPLGL